MGDRANVIVKSGYTGEQVCLYTHWNGSGLAKIVQAALIRGAERLEDFQYITRIIFSEMTRGHEEELTGFGITNRPQDGEDNNIIYFDVANQTVQIDTALFSVQEFVRLRMTLESNDG